jgi:hypothetical protein
MRGRCCFGVVGWGEREGRREQWTHLVRGMHHVAGWWSKDNGAARLMEWKAP